MRRLFTKRQRRILAWVAGGQCAICGEHLKKDFHADHVLAFANDGKTTTTNGQALCPQCNLGKGSQ